MNRRFVLFSIVPSSCPNLFDFHSTIFMPIYYVYDTSIKMPQYTRFGIASRDSMHFNNFS
uniref:Uncharacterized protein n=1 Tax=Picea sitchensis TaxID=3332 RepID=A0A6B9XR54_PICSI|nr:hypothetical protein Q903MT_gene5639 [Picea sitchensis]